MRIAFAAVVTRLVSRLTRLLGRGGSALPGRIGLLIAPRAIEKLTARLAGGVTVVTGTNGKTTTTKMIVTMLEGAGHDVLTNRSGSNLAQGLATTLLAVSRRGRVPRDMAVFEIDEAAVRELGPRLRPRILVVTNLARDQLDRYGELATTAGHVAAAVGASERAVLNGDDPMVTALDGGATLWFGAVPDIRSTMPDDQGMYGSEASYEPPPADALLSAVEAGEDAQVVSVEIGGRTVQAMLRVPGTYNAYNAAAALLTVATLGLDPVDAATDLAVMEPAFGRGQVLGYRGREVVMLLVKNPAGFNQAIRLLGERVDPTRVLVAINDQHADGRDVSWLWDARVEDLGATPHRFGSGGVRAADMALRFKYAGVESWVEEDAVAALDRLVAETSVGDRVYLIPTYTAMLTFLDLLRPGVSRAEAWT